MRISIKEGSGRNPEGKYMLRLRPYKACDAQTIVSWIGDETMFRKWSADRFESYPITAEDLNRHYDRMADSDSFYEMTAFDETGVAGHLIMRFTDEKKTILRFGFVIVDDTKRRKGYGREMIALALKYAFDLFRAERVTLGVFDNNPSAYRCYKAAGFQEYSERNIFLLGENWRCIDMECMRANVV